MKYLANQSEFLFITENSVTIFNFLHPFIQLKEICLNDFIQVGGNTWLVKFFVGLTVIVKVGNNLNTQWYRNY